MLTQRNIEEAARSIGVAPNILLKWRKLPEFETAYREARKAAYRQAVARLQQGTSAATTTLLKVLIDPGTPPSVKVRAAEATFNHAAKAIEIDDVPQLRKELEAIGPTGLWLEAVRGYLRDHGFVQDPSESLAETTARALGIEVRGLRVCMEQSRLGAALLDRFAETTFVRFKTGV